MVNVERFCDLLKECGITMFTGVPDSLLKNFCAYVTDHSDEPHNIIASNEGAAVGIAAGHYLATGHPSVVYMQNSGIGNAVNPILSLADPKVYSIPMILLIGWRGEPGKHDEPQHVKQGEVTLPLLEAMDIPYVIMSEDDAVALSQTKEIISRSVRENRPCAIVVRKNTFGPYQLRNKAKNPYSVSREQALKMVVDSMEETDVAVSTTGKLSRELFEIREAKHQGHEHDFLTVGSMGHSCSIALGVALEKSQRRVWCLDGDGAVLMHTGSLANIGVLKPANYVHVLFNNGAHESVGAQPTRGFQIDAAALANAMGYRQVFTLSKFDEISGTLQNVRSLEGPIFIELKVGIDSRADLGRPTTTPIENKTALMEFLK